MVNNILSPSKRASSNLKIKAEGFFFQIIGSIRFTLQIVSISFHPETTLKLFWLGNAACAKSKPLRNHPSSFFYLTQKYIFNICSKISFCILITSQIYRKGDLLTLHYPIRPLQYSLNINHYIVYLLPQCLSRQSTHKWKSSAHLIVRHSQNYKIVIKCLS